MIKREIEFEREMHHFLPKRKEKLVCSHSEKEKAKRLIIDDCINLQTHLCEMASEKSKVVLFL